MALLSLNAVRKSFGSRTVLSELDFTVEPRARVGLVGANGSGKSTLLRLLAGIEEPDAGTSVRRRGVVVSYLPQHPLGDGRTPLETVRAARPDLARLDRELHRVSEQLGSPELAADLDRMARVLRTQEQLVERWEAAGGPSLDGRVRATLLDVGVEEGDLALPTNTLSGGQRKLIALAACLAQEPDVLLLDEPEAHLDAVGRSLLERLLAGFDGAAVVVSHDRYLLDETVSQIASLDGGSVRMWPGNYSAYTLARELELQRQQQAYVTQQKEIERLEAAIRRFEDWARRVVNERHIKQARVKQRQIDRMEKVERPVLERRKIALRLHPHVRGGQRVFELRHVGVQFGDDVVLADVELTVMHGERVGVVGANGAGKSVLLKTIVGDIEPTEGELWMGPSIRIGYLAQDQETLDPESSPLETVRLSHRCAEGEAVSLLMKFLFPYEQVRRPNKLLSGGERTRLQLLLLMLAQPNLLVLDEPTNHLDIESVEALEGALEEFVGTVCAISHDRYFLDRVVDRIVEVGHGEAVAFEGGYSDWFERRTTASVTPATR
ncbi:MAG: ABC-F family ATP-binding cassette domain-containing protein [Actinobacteria bacterium]|nr:ABC-F family ATP-binding cassette domain-containing protein [Actinomycetota bacterium]